MSQYNLTKQAVNYVTNLYNKLLKQYEDPDSPQTLRSLNMLCVRLVFCLYADDARLLSDRWTFHNYLQNLPSDEIRKGLERLFYVLGTEPLKRGKVDAELMDIPYVTSGLFDESVEIPEFTEEIKELLLNGVGKGFDWSKISPTVLGSVFESTLVPETRRSGGIHYTSVENIHKVIDPLFLDELKEELKDIKEIADAKSKAIRLTEFQNKLAGLKFLDPACGSGNFLVETYICLRQLENEVLEERRG